MVGICVGIDAKWRGCIGYGKACPYGMKAVLARKYLSQCSGHKHCKFRFRAPRSIEASASIDSTSRKRRSISLEKSTARQQKIVRAPKSALRRFLLSKNIANAMTFSTVLDHFRVPRSIEASASIDSTSKKRRSISLEKCTARQQKIVRVPKTAMRRF